MKNRYFILALLALPPLGHFLGFYLSGWHIISTFGIGLLISVGAMFLGPFVVAATVAFVLTKRWSRRVLLFLPIVLLQIPLFWLAPPGATSEMIGMAHHLRTQFSADQLRAAATVIQEKTSNGTLKTLAFPHDDEQLESWFTVLINQSELPESLRGRFKYVGLTRSNEGDKPEVMFAFSLREGIVCNSHAFEKDFFHYSIGPYVHAYRYQRL